MDGYFFIAFSVLLTQYAFYLWTEIQVSNYEYSKDESKLSFKMSHYYATTRDYYINRLKLRFFFFSVSAYWASFWCFYVIFNSIEGPVN